MPKVKEQEVKYPEHIKLEKIQEKSQTIGDFLEWLGTKGRQLAVYTEAHGSLHLDNLNIPPDDDWMPEGWYPLNYTIEKLLAEYFEIDLNRLEDEKRQILDEIRQQNKGG